MKNLITNYNSFINERYMAEEVQPTQTNLPLNFIKPDNINDASGANAKLNMLTSNYGFHPEEQAIQIGQNDVVRFYHEQVGKFTNVKQVINSKILQDVKEYQIEEPKQEIYYRVLQGSQDDPDSAELVDVVGILAATAPEPDEPTANPIEAPDTTEVETPGDPVQEELTAGQKKLPPGLQASILKKQGESPPKDDDPKDEDDKDKSEEDEDLVKEELTAGQKKLPPGLQAHILKKQGESPAKEDDDKDKDEDDDKPKDTDESETSDDDKKSDDDKE